MTHQRNGEAVARYRIASPRQKRRAQDIALLFLLQLFAVLRAPPQVAAKIPESAPITLSDKWRQLSRNGLALAVSREAGKGRRDVLRGRREFDDTGLIFSDVSRVILRHSTSGTTGRLV